MECRQCQSAASQLIEANACISSALMALVRGIDLQQAAATALFSTACPHEHETDAESDSTDRANAGYPTGRPEPDPAVTETHVVHSSERVVLTSREREVLTLVARGLSNRRIARNLGIAEKTVKNHLAAIFPKLQVSDRTQAALYAVRLGLVSP